MTLSQAFMIIALVFAAANALWIFYLIYKRFARSRLDDKRRKAIKGLCRANVILFILLLSIGVLLS